MADQADSRLTLTLALDPAHWRRHDKAHWAQVLVGAVDAAAPHIMQVERYEISDTLLRVHARAALKPAKLKRTLQADEGFVRLRARLADLGARPEFEIEAE